MEAHARSLLQRLNTSASPNPTKSPTPEAKPIATPISADSKTSETGPQITVISSPMQRPTQATLEGPDAIMSLKNLLVSARQRSRESSITQIPPSGEESHPTGSSSSETATQRPDSRLGPTSPNHTRHAVVNASDGETSANPEEMPSTPSGSKTSSLVSNGMEHLQETSHQARPPYGLRITNDVPSIVTLPFMKPHIPRLQIKTDDEGHTFPGDGIGHIANLSRTFDLYDRDIIGATTNYIVYALKDGRVRIIDQNSGTRAIAVTPSSSAVISLTIQDGFDSEESFLLVLDLTHDLTIWSIKPWRIDSSDVPLDYLVCLQTAGQKADQSFIPIAKWWPRFANYLAICVGLSVRIYALRDTESGQHMDISGDRQQAVSISVDTGVRDFSFSPDGSALAVVDYHGDILLWALCADQSFGDFYKTSSHLSAALTISKPTITFSLPPDLNPCSIQFLDLGDDNSSAFFTPLLLVGSSYNRRLHLVDISQGGVLQEIVLPSIKAESMPTQNFSMVYTKEKRFLTIGDSLSNSIYFLSLHTLQPLLDPALSQSDYIANVADRKFSRDRSIVTTTSFNYVTVLPFFPNHRLQSLAVTTSVDTVLDVFTAHSNGFTMLSPKEEDILPHNYLEANEAPTKIIFNPRLDCVLGLASREPSPSPRSVSPRSSSESLRSARPTTPPVVKKEPLREDQNASSNATEIINPVSQELAPKKTRASPRGSEKSISPSPPDPVKSPSAHEISMNKELELFISQALEQQYQRLANDQKLLTTIADDRHESILKVVSSTLTTNVGKLLEQTVRTTIEKSILPTINATVKKSVDQQLSKILSSPLEKSISKEVRSSVNDAIHKVLLDNDNGGRLSDQINRAIVTKLETTLQKDLPTRLSAIFEKSLAPLINKLEDKMQIFIDKTLQRIQKETRASQQETAKKLDVLIEAVAAISDQLKGDLSKTIDGTKSPSTSTSRLASHRQDMESQFKAGKYSAGIEIWSDCTDQEQTSLFEVCLEYSPSVLRDVDQLSLMSAANTISIDLKTHVEERLRWLQEIVILAQREGRFTEYWPRVLTLLDNRLDVAFEELSSNNPRSPLARKVAVTQHYTQQKLKEMKQ